MSVGTRAGGRRARTGRRRLASGDRVGRDLWQPLWSFRSAASPRRRKDPVPQRLHEATGLTGMATMTGSVTAGKALQGRPGVHRNTTNGFCTWSTRMPANSALSGCSGELEVSVTARGLKSDIQHWRSRPASSSLRFSLTDIPTDTESETDVAQNLEGTASNRVLVTLDSYDNVYPPGRGREIAESTCMICHGENFLSSQPARAEVWNTRIDRMVGKELHNRPAQSYADGLLGYRSQWARNWSLKDREELAAYLVKNFGPGAKPRNVRTVKETPLDEAKLGKAMYMEYYIPADGPGQGPFSRVCRRPRIFRQAGHPGCAVRCGRQRLRSRPGRSTAARQAQSPHRRDERVAHAPSQE